MVQNNMVVDLQPQTSHQREFPLGKFRLCPASSHCGLWVVFVNIKKKGRAETELSYMAKYAGRGSGTHWGALPF